MAVSVERELGMNIKASLKTGLSQLGKLSLRILAFVASIVTLWFVVVMLDRLLLPLIMTAFLDGFEPNQEISISAVIIFSLSANVLFQKIVRKKPAKTPLIILAIYSSLLVVDILLLATGMETLPGGFWGVCIIGLIGYFVLKPFKKPMVPKEKAHEV